MGLLKPILPCLPRPDDDIQRVHGHSPAQLLIGGGLVSSLLLATRTVLQGLHISKAPLPFVYFIIVLRSAEVILDLVTAPQTTQVPSIK